MYKRWYDKYPDLKSLMLLLETVDEEHIEIISQDFLQLMAEKYGTHFDEVIQNLSSNAPPRYSRWYDNNYNLHTCIEFIKSIENDKEREDLINAFIMSLLSFVTNVDHE